MQRQVFASIWFDRLKKAKSYSESVKALQLLFTNENGYMETDLLTDRVADALYPNEERLKQRQEILPVIKSLLSKVHTVLQLSDPDDDNFYLRCEHVHTMLLQFTACYKDNVTLEEVNEANANYDDQRKWLEYNASCETVKTRLPTREQCAEDRQARDTLLILKEQIEIGLAILQHKLKQLSDERDASKIKILQEAIGAAEPAWGSDKEGLGSLLDDVNRKIAKPDRPLKRADVQTIFRQLDTVIDKKVQQPLRQYDNERFFLGKIKEWLSDTAKKIFSFRKQPSLSTKGTLFNVSDSLKTIFSIVERKTSNSPGR